MDGSTSSIWCGRMERATRAPGASPAAPMRNRKPAHATLSGPTATPSTTLVLPMNSATKRVRGWLNSSSAVPTWATRPAWRTAMRSEMTMASAWSCVT